LTIRLQLTLLHCCRSRPPIFTSIVGYPHSVHRERGTTFCLVILILRSLLGVLLILWTLTVLSRVTDFGLIFWDLIFFLPPLQHPMIPLSRFRSQRCDQLIQRVFRSKMLNSPCPSDFLRRNSRNSDNFDSRRSTTTARHFTPHFNFVRISNQHRHTHQNPSNGRYSTVKDS